MFKFFYISIIITDNLSDFKDVDLVVEAVLENKEVE